MGRPARFAKTGKRGKTSKTPCRGYRKVKIDSAMLFLKPKPDPTTHFVEFRYFNALPLQ